MDGLLPPCVAELIAAPFDRPPLDTRAAILALQAARELNEMFPSDLRIRFK